MGLLNGKVAFITGAGRGQGRAHAVTLAKEGADIVAVDVDGDIDTADFPMARESDLKETAAQVGEVGRRIIWKVADVRSQDALDAVVKEGIDTFGKVDIAVANAGIYAHASLLTMTDRQWDEMIDVNLTGVWRTMRAVIPHMVERREGSIVLTSSTNGLVGNANAAHYTAAKHGVLGLMRSAALELGAYRIRVNAVCPGLVDSAMTNWQGMYDRMAGHEGGTREDWVRASQHSTIIAKQGGMPPEQIAKAAAWLAADTNFTMTGHALVVDAGTTEMPGFNPNPNPMGL
ncbi:mycofactocin-coupled SDR family oxidoreductase [Nocardia rhamnosiphila]|uniref:Mycofactocin-coupled SDR family oxidoreductase n=1 Tax=Nocardia rhamnosiphila TaxID=426716 RepID=A0ABV2WYP2_9NOCA